MTDYRDTFIEENKSMSGDGFIIEMGGALFCVACDFIVGPIDAISTHMKEKHNFEFEGNMTTILTKHTTVLKKIIEHENCAKKTLNEELYARNYNIT